MKCQWCNQNEATIHMTQMVDGKPEELHICETCAKERGEIQLGIEIPLGAGLENGFALPFSLDQFFHTFVKNLLINNGEKKEEASPSSDLGPGADVCMRCGKKLEDYLKDGEGGCEYCYEAFRPWIVRMLEEGMKPKFIPDDSAKRRATIQTLNELLRLRTDMELSVAVEDYEAAAELRDRIRQLTESL